MIHWIWVNFNIIFIDALQSNNYRWVMKVNCVNYLKKNRSWIGKGYEHYRLSPIEVDFRLMQMINRKIQIISMDSGRFTEAHNHHKEIKRPVKIILTFYERYTDNCNGMLYASVLSTAGPGTLPRMIDWVTKNSYVIPWVWLEIFVNTIRSSPYQMFSTRNHKRYPIFVECNEFNQLLTINPKIWNRFWGWKFKKKSQLLILLYEKWNICRLLEIKWISTAGVSST